MPCVFVHLLFQLGTHRERFFFIIFQCQVLGHRALSACVYCVYIKCVLGLECGTKKKEEYTHKTTERERKKPPTHTVKRNTQEMEKHSVVAHLNIRAEQLIKCNMSLKKKTKFLLYVI